MKLAAALLSVASAAANDASVVDANCKTKEGNVACWESYFTLAVNNVTQKLEVDPDSMEGSCGLQYEWSSFLVNSTCTVNFGGGAPFSLTFGNGAFVAPDQMMGEYKVTGFDGVSGKVSAIATWDTYFDAAWVDANKNATTGELIITNTTEFNHEDCFTTGLNKWIEVSCVDNGSASSDPAIMFTYNSPGAENNFAIANYGAKDSSLMVILNVPCDTSTISSPMGDITPSMDFDCSFSITVTDDAPQLLYFQATTTKEVNFFDVTIV